MTKEIDNVKCVENILAINSIVYVAIGERCICAIVTCVFPVWKYIYYCTLKMDGKPKV
jgi:hypothetical protein